MQYFHFLLDRPTFTTQVRLDTWGQLVIAAVHVIGLC